MPLTSWIAPVVEVTTTVQLARKSVTKKRSQYYGYSHLSRSSAVVDGSCIYHASRMRAV